jgi:hypothetical protein
MSDPKPIASLSSGLLARKGQAAPAMRRQVGLTMAPAAPEPSEEPQLTEDDLGWNDMGETLDYLPGRAGLSPMAASPVAAPAPVEPIHQDVAPVQTEAPAVVVQQQQLERQFDAVQGPVPAPVVSVAPVASAQPARSPAPVVPTRAAPGSKGKAAFTLRLDADRHLKLRLVCAIGHRSAQQVVTDALDAYLATQALPEGFGGVVNGH